jgi:hypothetical protein
VVAVIVVILKTNGELDDADDDLEDGANGTVNTT